MSEKINNTHAYFSYPEMRVENQERKRSRQTIDNSSCELQNQKSKRLCSKINGPSFQFENKVSKLKYEVVTDAENGDLVGDLAKIVVSGKKAVRPTITFDQMRSIIDEKTSKLQEIIPALNYSREYEKSERRFPSHEEFAPLVDGFLDLNRSCQKLLPNFFREDYTSANAYYVEKMKSLITSLTTRVREDALQSRNLEKDLLENSSNKGKKKVEFNLYRVQSHIDELTNKPVERPILEIRELLNVQLFSHYTEKANTNEIGFFRMIWQFYERNMK